MQPCRLAEDTPFAHWMNAIRVYTEQGTRDYDGLLDLTGEVAQGLITATLPEVLDKMIRSGVLTEAQVVCPVCAMDFVAQEPFLEVEPSYEDVQALRQVEAGWGYAETDHE